MADHSSTDKIKDGSPEFPSERLDKFVLRLPDGMRDQIKSAAKENGRSMNAEIIARLASCEKGSTPLRDLFAGQALAGLCAISNSDVIAARSGMSTPDVRRVIACACYLMADAMLEMRGCGGEKTAAESSDAVARRKS